MARKKKNISKDQKDRWTFWKASQARSSWRSRAKKNDLPLEDIPNREEIQKWLDNQEPLKCYITKTIISKEVIELDHKQPLVRGGSLKLNNVGITSRWYNNIKGQMTEKEFRQLLTLVNKWEDKGQALFKRLSASNHIYRRSKKK